MTDPITRAQRVIINGVNRDYIPNSLTYFDGSPTRESTMMISGANLPHENFTDAPFIEFNVKATPDNRKIYKELFDANDKNAISIVDGADVQMTAAFMTRLPDWKNQDEVTIRFEGQLFA